VVGKQFRKLNTLFFAGAATLFVSLAANSAPPQACGAVYTNGAVTSVTIQTKSIDNIKAAIFFEPQPGRLVRAEGHPFILGHRNLMAWAKKEAVKKGIVLNEQNIIWVGEIEKANQSALAEARNVTGGFTREAVRLKNDVFYGPLANQLELLPDFVSKAFDETNYDPASAHIFEPMNVLGKSPQHELTNVVTSIISILGTIEKKQTQLDLIRTDLRRLIAINEFVETYYGRPLLTSEIKTASRKGLGVNHWEELSEEIRQQIQTGAMAALQNFRRYAKEEEANAVLIDYSPTH
jgi:hypothetical protein